MQMSRENAYFVCPHCGAEVPASKHFCRECGASDEIGWEADGPWDGGLSSGEDFDYEEYIEREFPNDRPSAGKNQLVRFLFLTIIVLLCISFTLMSILGI